MKLGNIVRAGAALTVALASCSQKEEGVAVSGNPKAVTVSFANVTRSVGDKVDKDKTALYEDFTYCLPTMPVKSTRERVRTLPRMHPSISPMRPQRAI